MTIKTISSKTDANKVYDLVINEHGVAISCNCLGNQYRKTCTHVTEYNDTPRNTATYEVFCYGNGADTHRVASRLSNAAARALRDASNRTCTDCGGSLHVYAEMNVNA